MDVPLFHLQRWTQSLTEETEAAVLRAVRSGRYILGPEVAALEKAFAAYLGCSHVVAVQSGTAALHLALLAGRLAPGSAVGVPSFTFAATAEAVLHAGCRPVFLDVDPADGCLSQEEAERALREGVGALVAVHLFGNLCPVTPELGFRWVVEDACQAHGASWDGRLAGGLGHVGCFSFYPTKNLPGVGDGGALATADGDAAQRLRRLRNHGQDAMGAYEHAEVGYNYRLGEIESAALRVRLAHLDRWVAERRALAHRYDEGLSGTPVIPVRSSAPQAEPAPHLYVVRAPRRDELAAHLRVRGVAVAVHYPLPLYRQPAFADYAPSRPLPGSERLAREVLSLPFFPGLTEEELDYVCAQVRTFYG